MQQPSDRRVGIGSKLVERARGLISVNLSESDCVALCIGCMMPNDRGSVAGFLCSHRQLGLVEKHADQLALTKNEFCDLFGKDSHCLNSDLARRVCESKSACENAQSVEHALQCSLVEPGARAAWARHVSKLACIVALHTEEAEEMIGAVLGGMVRADLRRLEDLRCDIEDGDTDTMLLFETVTALASAVTR